MPSSVEVIGVAGDDARYNLAGQRAIMILISLPLQTVHKLENCRWPVFVMRENLSLGWRTLDPIFKVVAWSINVAFAGKFPSVGPDGTAFARSSGRMVQAGSFLHGGPFALAEIRGDWKWHREVFCLRRHYTAQNICLFCKATRTAGPCQYTNFERFKITGFDPLSPAQFTLHSLGNYVSPLCMVVGFTPRMIALCSMHTSNLGLCGWINGAALLALLDRNFFGQPSDDLGHRLKIVTLRFRNWCSAMRIPQSQPWITIGMLHCQPGTAPELTLKAYHARVFVAFMAVCTRTFLDGASAEDRTEEMLLTHTVCASLAQWHLHLEMYPRYLTQSQAENLNNLAMTVLQAYRSLARIHSRLGSLRWPLRPKHHSFQEINGWMLASRYNARLA